MGRKPEARQKVLDAARTLVIERGAGALTFEELAQASGVTRGGITYHFPTKQALLSALVEHDLEHWRAIEAAHRPEGVPDELADFLAHVRVHTSNHSDQRRFVAGMMSAVMLDPDILEPARAFESAKFSALREGNDDLRKHVLYLAAIGMFWTEFFDCPRVPSELRDRLRQEIERLAQEWIS